MAKFFIKKGTTSKLVHIFIQDSSSTTGAGLTGLTSGSTGLVCYRARQDDGNAGGTQLVLSAGTRGTWSSGGFVEKDSTNMPGVYELGLDNAGLATGVNDVLYMLKGATNMAPLALEIQLVDFDPQSSSNLGLSALPTANPGAASGIFIAGTNAATTITTAGGSALTLSSTGANGNGLAISGNGSGAGLSVTGGGTGAGAKFIGGGTSGDGIDITTTSGDGLSILPTAGNGIVATANVTTKHGAVITGGTAGTSDGLKAVAGTGGVDIRGNITGNVTGNLSGSVGSVTARVTANTDQIVGVAVSTTTAQLGVNVVQYNAQTAQTDANNLPKVDTEDWKGGIVPAPNVAGEPLVDVNHWRGTQPAILDANAMVKADVEDVGGVVLSTHTAGMLPGDTRNWVGTTIAAPSTSGVPDVNVKNFNNVAAVSLPANFNLMSISAAGAVAITSATKKNQALNGFMFTMTDSTTHGPKPGLGVGITAQRSLDGGAFAGTVSNPTELSNGVYILNLAAGDMNGNNVMLRLTAAASDDLNILLITQP